MNAQGALQSPTASSVSTKGFMRTSARILFICCLALALGSAWVGFWAGGAARNGGLFFGSLMVFLAALLGADHTANPRGASSRRPYKIMAVLGALPLLGVGVWSVYAKWTEGEALHALLGLGPVLVLAGSMAMLVFDHRRAGGYVLRRLGIDAPPSRN